MACEEPDVDALNKALSSAQVFKEKQQASVNHKDDEVGDGGGMQITCFSEVVNDVSLHFQILRFPKQVWISFPPFFFFFVGGGSIVVSLWVPLITPIDKASIVSFVVFLKCIKLTLF